ncbi:hypothetical protein C2845_PM09G16130 [Panicum miliaceum]|uniref:RNase H type-1 domain-containing protein n=1 Tax=Panicum miliaceum TaxID=4540 RepID=A0A3L6S107_PANMI|nr:hypothetical protein C2845_PM09G16130 [Panicum miliaceum]
MMKAKRRCMCVGAPQSSLCLLTDGTRPDRISARGAVNRRAKGDHTRTAGQDSSKGLACEKIEEGVERPNDLLASHHSQAGSDIHNDRRHGKAAITLDLAIQWAMDVCFQLMTESVSHKKGEQSQMAERWRRPPNGHVKVNTDGAYIAADSSGATVVVIRRADGSFLAASAQGLDSVASTLLTEAEALRDGIWLIPEGTLEWVIVETDSKELVSLWRSRGMDRSELTVILSDVQELLSVFPSFEVAHLCAKGSFNVCSKEVL